ncbi:cell division protein [Thermococcus profundus]|uniref:Cell division protein n=1 Tax=Thermococcus profundus TaxID=49899 RepID=A0A2Z2M7R1_THEPR|nr:ATP-binding protein [Thermococcus profundus]ASJ02277.1 cell division protein [Thermococcus profundus]
MQVSYGARIARYEQAYQEAIERGDFSRARLLAIRCADLLRNMASENLEFSDYYLELAAQWEKRAEELKDSPPRQKGTFQISDLISRSTVTWDDVGGLWDAKRILASAIGLNLARVPGKLEPWKGVLLFGPPGTGKSLLASAVAGSIGATFINVSVSNVLSKYFGESSKLAASVYELARRKSPSIVFIDEFDALAMKRSSLEDAARRVLSTFLVEIDGFKRRNSRDRVITLAATNRPWDLDEAILSRFPLRIYVPLPDERSAVDILRIHLRGFAVRADLRAVARTAVRRLFSGRDLANLARMTVMKMLSEMNPELSNPKLVGSLAGKELTTRPLEMDDFKYGLRKIKSPITQSLVKKYEKWAEEFGL